MGVTIEGSDWGNGRHRRIDIRFSNMNRFFSPRDWKIKHSIVIEQPSGMHEWIDENIKGWWEFEGWNTGDMCLISFTRDEDAMVFKLRWL